MNQPGASHGATRVPPRAAPEAPPSAAERVFTARNGAIFRRGVFVLPESAEELLRLFEADAKDKSDWFHAAAGRLAAELREAMAEAYPAEDLIDAPALDARSEVGLVGGRG